MDTFLLDLRQDQIRDKMAILRVRGEYFVLRYFYCLDPEHFEQVRLSCRALKIINTEGIVSSYSYNTETKLHVTPWSVKVYDPKFFFVICTTKGLSVRMRGYDSANLIYLGERLAEDLKAY